MTTPTDPTPAQLHQALTAARSTLEALASAHRLAAPPARHVAALCATMAVTISTVQHGLVRLYGLGVVDT